jgi:uncharacterized membrane protein
MATKRTARTESPKSGPDQEVACPSERYFQVHFQYLHEIIGDLQHQLHETSRLLAELKEASSNVAAAEPFRQNDRTIRLKRKS